MKEKATSSKQDAEVSVPCLTHDEDMFSSDAKIDILPSSSGGWRRQLPEGLSSSAVFWVDCDKCGSSVQCLCFWQ